MCWMYLRNSGCICKNKKTKEKKISLTERGSRRHGRSSWNPGADLLGQQRDEVFGFPLQVQVHVEQLAVESFVDLLLPLQTAGLLHGPLHALPVQVAGQVSQENPHVLHAVQGDAQLAESKEEEEEEERQRVEVETQKKEKKQGYREAEGRGERLTAEGAMLPLSRCVSRKNAG